MIKVYQHSIGQIYIKLCKKGYELSIAMDNPYKEGLPTTMSRGDILVYKNNKDVTKNFYPEYKKNIPVSIDWNTLKNFMDKIDKL